MIEYITANNIEHPAICVAFTPDEEIGMGTEHLTLNASELITHTLLMAILRVRYSTRISMPPKLNML